jgi:hypothetical protein
VHLAAMRTRSRSVERAGSAFLSDEEAERSLVHALMQRIALSVLVMGLLWTVLIAVIIDQVALVP